MKRGEIWTVAARGDYTGKPRPAVVVQDDHFQALDSVALCALTTDPKDAPLLRVLSERSESNGLSVPSRMMVDKIVTVAKERLGKRIGYLDDDALVRLNRAMMVFLGPAGSRRS